MKAILATGATGGHVFPAFSVAEKILEREPGAEMIFVGRETGPERKWVEERRFAYRSIRSAGRVRRGFGGTLKALRDAGLAGLECRKIIREIEPDVALGFGGFVSGPLLLAAKLAGAPTAIHEGNAIPGRVNRWLGRRVTKVFVGEASQVFAKAFRNPQTVGIPVRPEVVNQTPDYGALGLQEGVTTVLVFGGSLGAMNLCSAALEASRELDRQGILHQMLLQVGRQNADWLRSIEIPKSVRPVEFIGDMGNAYSCADVVVARAGMSSIAEIAANGLPSILVPYPYAVDDHQRRNAEVLERTGASHMILDRNLTGETLAAWLRLLLPREETLRAMGERARALHRPDAADRMAKEIIGMVRDRRREAPTKETTCETAIPKRS